MSDNPLKGVGVVGGDKEKLRRMDNAVRLRCKSYACVNLRKLKEKGKTVKCKLRLQRCVSLIKDYTCSYFLMLLSLLGEKWEIDPKQARSGN